MKPMIIYDMEIVDNKVHIDKDKFEKLIQEVYESGVKDGKATSLIGYGNLRNNESVTTNPKPINIYYTEDKGKTNKSYIEYKQTNESIIDHYKEANQGRCAFDE